MKYLIGIASAVSAFTLCGPLGAEVTAEEAKALGATLTEFGAVKAGNADGSIPPYTGGRVDKFPAGYKGDDRGNLPDPFKDDKPVYSVDAKNMAQYDALLTEGSKALMKRFPTYRIDVYPTHRVMSYPDWVLKNTVKNATTAKLVGESEGDTLQGAMGGIPFPIPKTGYEVLWNHTMRYQGSRFEMRFKGWLVDAGGRVTNVGDEGFIQNNYYYDQRLSTLPDNWFSKGLISFYGPPSNVGMKILQWSSIDQSKLTSRNWIYTPGQRRTRITPEAAYDTPSAAVSGANFAEEQAMYTSRLDRFEYKLVGRKEMLIPYNNYGFVAMPSAAVVGKEHLKPEGQRWEKHRVWVVEGTRKAGARHVYARRTFYIDEDSWAITASDSWDDSGAVYRVAFAFNAMPYDKPGVPPQAQVFYDLVKGNYVATVWLGDGGYARPFDTVTKEISFNPDEMAGTGIR